MELQYSLPKHDVNYDSGVFSRAEIYVMYHGKNRNNSYMSKEVVMKAIPTLKNIPIVGKFIEESENFGSHEGSLDITDDGELIFEYKTTPFGVIPESFKYHWELINGKEYLVIDNAYMWNRNIKQIKALKESNFGQSMEININESEFGDKNVLIIKDFTFEALCILGVDKNGEGHVEPCFEDSHIAVYEHNEKNEINEMMKEFSLFINNKEGGNNLEKEKELVVEDAKVDEIIEDEVVEKIEETTEDVSQSTEEIKEEKTIEEEEIVEEVIEVVEKDETIEEEVDEPIQEDLSEYESCINELKKENEQLKKEIEAFKFKEHKIKCDKKIEEFKKAYGLTDEDLVKFKKYDLELNELESKLFELLGRKAKTLLKENKKDSRIVYNLEVEDNNNTKFSVFDTFFK